MQEYFEGEKAIVSSVNDTQRAQDVVVERTGTIRAYDTCYGGRYFVLFDEQRKQRPFHFPESESEADGFRTTNSDYFPASQLRRKDPEELNKTLKSELEQLIERVRAFKDTEKATVLATLRNLNKHLRK